MLFPFGSDGLMRRYGANYRASFNGFNTRIVFCDHDGGAEAIALFQSFVSVTNPAPNPGVFATVQKISCSSVDDLKSTVLAHASHASTGKDTVVGGVRHVIDAAAHSGFTDWKAVDFVTYRWRVLSRARAGAVALSPRAGTI
jgi:hypothetical protein